MIEVISPEEAIEIFNISPNNKLNIENFKHATNLSFKQNGKNSCLLSLKFDYSNNAEIFYFHILPDTNNPHWLISEAKNIALKNKAKTISVILPTNSEFQKLFENNGFQPLFNLEPNNTCLISILTEHSKKDFSGLNIRIMLEEDAKLISEAFKKQNWDKPEQIFTTYFKEQEQNERIVWIAFYNNEVAGYVTLKWSSNYQPFLNEEIPEIKDLNVLPPFRGKGIGSSLLDIAEHEAGQKHSKVGIGVGLYKAYGIAQKLYINRGYIPDRLGITYSYQHVEPGNKVNLDDDLILWFTKNLK